MKIIAITVAAVFMVAAGAAHATTQAGEHVPWQVVASGATDGLSSAHKLQGSMGQAAVGAGSGSGHSLRSGFWQNFVTGEPSCCHQSGDINHSGSGPDIVDLVYLVTYMFQGGSAPGCMEETDVNGSGSGPDITDLVYLVTFMFQGGSPPVPCP